MKFLSVLLVLFFVSPAMSSAPSSATPEPRLRFLDIITEIPSSSFESLDTAFSKEAIPAWAAIAVSTGLMIHYDEKILLHEQANGRRWGIGNGDNTRPAIKAYGIHILRLPTDTGSALYYIGDGWTQFAIAGSFLGYGALTDNNYNFNTGIMILHGISVGTIFNQFLKRTTGRESPYVRTMERGSWRPFPSFEKYNGNTPRYDAFPSGHVMAATITMTVIAERYKEYAVPVYAVGGTLITALGWQMINNGVHWISDYPLAIGMGMLYGKIASRMGQKKKKDDATTQKGLDWEFVPTMQYGTPMMTAVAEF